MVACGPRMVVSMLLTYFAAQGNPLALQFTDDSFWKSVRS